MRASAQGNQVQGKAVTAVGRHRAEPVRKAATKPARETAAGDRRQSARNQELLAWGVFLTVVGAAAMVWVEVPPGTVATASALLLFAFGVAWCFSTSPAAPGAGSPAAAPSPAAAKATSVPGPSVPGPAAQSAAPPQAAAAYPGAPAPALPAARRRSVRALPSPVPPPSPGPVRVNRGAPHGRRAAATPVLHEMPAEPSRWTRTFGPPDTGQIPLQPYLAGSPASFAMADADLPDRRQRSHSSL